MSLPVLSCLVDWAVDGTFTNPLCDISGYVQGVEVDRGDDADLGSGGKSSSATIHLLNADGRFNPLNGGSPYAPYLLPGRPVWIRVTYGGLTYGLFAGYLKRIVPMPGLAGLADIICDDGLGRYGYGYIDVPAGNYSARALRSYILDQMGESAARRDLAIEDEVLVIAVTRDRAQNCLNDLNLATLSRHFIAPGVAEPAWYLYTTRNRQYRLASMADASLTDGQIADSDGWDLSDEALINSQAANLTDGSSVSKSVTSYGAVYAGDDINSPFLATEAIARGVVQHLVWRFADPRGRPSIGLLNEFPLMFARGLYDVILATVESVSASARRYEIVGQKISMSVAAQEWRASWRLQETPEQGNPPSPGFFVLGTSRLDSTDRLGY